ncbi:MAG: haloacid dehalogenase, partial [Gammaproteobacteria bacterium]|nr:haloacid dehalogenase [Gammaproteobacteria bacterium]
GEVLHVAQSLFHDVQPGRAAGLSTCWIDRRAGRPGGATPPVDVEPDITFTDLASLAAWHRAG